MEIGKVYKFNYESQSKSKPKDDPVKIILTEEKKASIIKEVQTYALAKEKEFEDLTNLLMENKYFDNIKELERVDAERKARSARARKTEEQKELEIIIEGQYDGYIKKFTPDQDKANNKSITDLFIRAYSEANMELTEDGKIEAILISKSYTKAGHIAYKFIVFSPMTVEKSALYQMKDFEYVE